MSEVRGKLAKVARERGQTVEQTIGEAVRETGSVLGAATALGVAPNAVLQWVKVNGYQVKRVVRAELVKVVR
jgi:ABC-type phosphate/phosphonate transport system permease subunit